MRGCLRGTQLGVYPPPACWEACRSVASLAAERDSSELEGFSRNKSQKAQRHLPELAAAAQPPSRELNQIVCVCVFHHDKVCTPEHACFFSLKQPVLVFVFLADCIFEFLVR